ncbi:MAG: endolytic transglycosylase MltG [Solirubrobacterales bacterium]|nr:endolytic transglycosylase MltG [Solirubrobacterales bacterium]MBV9425326.1 endolytic transglycosylase MltG [Solirubrobacterales bacterium]MBV9800306.1 endolytic transglycosylase MltG [Solirubrobacterales bacterium]
MSDHERTAEEREAARLEREQRRLEEQSYDEGESFDEEEEEEEREVASGTRRVSRRHRASMKRAAGSERRPRPARRERAPRRVEKRHSWTGRIVSVLALVAGAALIWFLVELFQPFHGSGNGGVTVTIPAELTSSQVGDLLAREGVISSGFFFEIRATLAGDRGDLRSGTYQLKRDMSYGDVLKILTTPPPAAKVTELTITEGRTRRQIDALLRSQGVAGSYLAATRHSPLLDPGHYGAPAGTSSLEGFLFPSTYQLREPVSIPALVADQLKTFRQRFASVNLGYARSQHVTRYDVLTIASMIEAEASTAHDRPLVASVIYNRLADGMPLQIDATTRYATGNYTQPLTEAELNSPSPYNTRIHKGLPPTPIDNPGLPSIEAAAHPANTNYLYFVVKPCGNGEQSFTSSYKQFEVLAQQYQNARARRGGRSPVHC